MQSGHTRMKLMRPQLPLAALTAQWTSFCQNIITVCKACNMLTFSRGNAAWHACGRHASGRMPHSCEGSCIAKQAVLSNGGIREAAAAGRARGPLRHGGLWELPLAAWR